MPWSTSCKRCGSSRASGYSKETPALRMRALARTSRWPSVEGEVRNAPAMRAASSPSTTWSMSGARAAASMAGCAQTKSSRKRSSGTAAPSTVPTSTSPASRSSACVAASWMRLWRQASSLRCRATLSSHASGCSGMPSAGQRSRALAKAWASAFSDAAMSCVRAERIASSRPYDSRAARSAARGAAGSFTVRPEFQLHRS